MKKEDNPFILTDSRKIYKNPWIDVREDSVIRPGGKPGIFGVVEIQPGVSVVPLASDGTMYLVRQYRYVQQAYVLECMSGGMDAGEEPLVTAKRELREELGGESDEWTSLGTIRSFGTVNGTAHLFLAQNTVLKYPQHTDEGEVIEICPMPFTVAYEKVQSGEITHAPSVAAILKTYILLNQ